MSATPSWSVMLIILFSIVGLLVVATVLVVRRRKQLRGFEVIMKPEDMKLPEAKKE